MPQAMVADGMISDVLVRDDEARRVLKTGKSQNENTFGETPSLHGTQSGVSSTFSGHTLHYT